MVRSRSERLGLDPDFHQKFDVHVHVPEGATPKDGPSAGIAMVTALVSILSGVPVRADVAMTGEITLRGRVLPIGGLKEKLLAALRGGIKTVIIPEENRKDLADIPKNVTQGLEIIPVKWIDEVLDIALVRPIVPQPGEVPTPVGRRWKRPPRPSHEAAASALMRNCVTGRKPARNMAFRLARGKSRWYKSFAPVGDAIRAAAQEDRTICAPGRTLIRFTATAGTSRIGSH